MNKFLYLLSILSFVCFQALTAQELLTSEKAVSFALEKNYDIILAKSQADIANIYNSAATAGMLPKINATAGDAFNLNNINQKFTTGQEVKKDWVPINNFNAGVNLDWTIFDGLKMFATKDRLEALAAVGDLQLKDKIQNTVASVLNAYYDIVRLQQQLKAFNTSLSISEERVKLTQQKFDIGYSDKTPLLQAKVDDAQMRINILKQKNAIEQSKISLNQLLGRSADIDFDVIDTIVVNYHPQLLQLKDSMMRTNFSIQSAYKNIDIANFQRKEISAQRLPLVKLNTGYAFSQNNSKAGLVLYNQSYGPSLGLNANIPLFSGGIVKKQLQASSINIAGQKVQLNKIKNDLDATLSAAYKNYTYAQNMLALNEENVKLSEENVSITLNRFRLNQSNSVEMKQAQGSYEDALYNLILARYNAKIAEIELKKLSNDLLK